jgi:hypothetical protein
MLLGMTTSDDETISIPLSLKRKTVLKGYNLYKFNKEFTSLKYRGYQSAPKLTLSFNTLINYIYLTNPPAITNLTRRNVW